jgi:hydrogenase maturation protease
MGAPSTTTGNPRPARTLVVGLGNVLLKDDGVGVHAVRQLRKLLPRRILAVDVGTAVLDALHLFEWADRIIGIDAMQAGGSPGTIYTFGVDDVEDGGVRASLHEMGLVAALRLLKGRHPRITMLAVEPETMDCGLELSAPVQAALPALVEAARKMAEQEPQAAPLKTFDL